MKRIVTTVAMAAYVTGLILFLGSDEFLEGLRAFEFPQLTVAAVLIIGMSYIPQWVEYVSKRL